RDSCRLRPSRRSRGRWGTDDCQRNAAGVSRRSGGGVCDRRSIEADPRRCIARHPGAPGARLVAVLYELERGAQVATDRYWRGWLHRIRGWDRRGERHRTQADVASDRDNRASRSAFSTGNWVPGDFECGARHEPEKNPGRQIGVAPLALPAARNVSVAETSTISAVAMTSTWATGVNWSQKISSTTALAPTQRASAIVKAISVGRLTGGRVAAKVSAPA